MFSGGPHLLGTKYTPDIRVVTDSGGLSHDFNIELELDTSRELAVFVYPRLPVEVGAIRHQANVVRRGLGRVMVVCVVLLQECEDKWMQQ